MGWKYFMLYLSLLCFSFDPLESRYLMFHTAVGERCSKKTSLQVRGVGQFIQGHLLDALRSAFLEILDDRYDSD